MVLPAPRAVTVIAGLWTVCRREAWCIYVVLPLPRAFYSVAGGGGGGVQTGWGRLSSSWSSPSSVLYIPSPPGRSFRAAVVGRGVCGRAGVLSGSAAGLLSFPSHLLLLCSSCLSLLLRESFFWGVPVRGLAGLLLGV